MGTYFDQAIQRRNKYNNPIISVTGTSGKTTTTKFIYDIFKNFYKVDKTYKERNSVKGIPNSIMTEFDLNSDYWIIEIGISSKNEMNKLLSLVKPKIRILTRIGIAHTSNFNTEDDYHKEKLKFIDISDEETIFVINGDDPIIVTHHFPKNCQIIKCGFNDDNDIKVKNIKTNENNIDVEIEYNGKIGLFKIYALGPYNGLNLALAIGCALTQGITFDDIISKCKNFTVYDNRGCVFYNSNKSIFLLNHSYNCSFTSIKCNLQYLTDIPKNYNILILLGDILGIQKSIERHEEILLECLKITNNVITYSTKYYKEILKKTKINCKLFEDEDKLKEYIFDFVNECRKPLYIFVQKANEEKYLNLKVINNVIDDLVKKYKINIK